MKNTETEGEKILVTFEQQSRMKEKRNRYKHGTRKNNISIHGWKIFGKWLYVQNILFGVFEMVARILYFIFRNSFELLLSE